VGVAFAFPIFFVSMPVFSKMMGNRSIFETGGSLGLYLFIGIWSILMIFFIKWGISKYANITKRAGAILKELDQ